VPLIALLNKEEFDADDLTESHRGLDFRCPDPECNDVLLAVMGPIKIKHFRHTTKGHLYHEPETAEHLALKKLVKDACDALQIKCKLEPYIFQHNQKRNPDCLVTLDEEIQEQLNIKGIAVECQCTPMHTRIYEERNLFYLDNGYTPVWIFGEKNYSSRILNGGDIGVKLKSLERAVLRDYKKVYYTQKGDIFETKQNDEYETNPVISHLNLKQTSVKEIIDYLSASKNSLFNGGVRCGFFSKVDGRWVPISNLKRYEKSPAKNQFLKDTVETEQPQRSRSIPSIYSTSYQNRVYPKMSSSRWQDKMMVNLMDIEMEYTGNMIGLDLICDILKEYITKYGDISLVGVKFYLDHKKVRNELETIGKMLLESKFIEWKPSEKRFCLKQKRNEA